MFYELQGNPFCFTCMKQRGKEKNSKGTWCIKEPRKKKVQQKQVLTQGYDDEGYQSTKCSKQHYSNEIAKELFLFNLEPDN